MSEADTNLNGVGRRLDRLGRVVIPADIRRTLGLDSRTPLNISVDGERIVLTLVQPQSAEESCVFCGRTDGLRTYRSMLVCGRCIRDLADTYEPVELGGESNVRPRTPPRHRKSHCPRGHPYAGDNLYIDPRGNKRCRACKRLASAARTRLP